MQSALTGHMVFSTLHTNNAAGVIPRLIDLKVNPKILGSALTLSMAQRLVRKLCTYCKKEDTANEKEIKIINSTLESIAKNKKGFSLEDIKQGETYKIYSAVGCDKCNKTGYHGRIGVFEAIRTNEEIEKLIPVNPSEREVKKAAKAQGILSMKEDGIIKVLRGVTSIAELESVVDLSEEE